MKKILLGLLCLSVIFIIGCGGSAVILDSPEITRVAMDSTSVFVNWEYDTTIENHEDFQGYNVYVYTDSSELLVEDGEDLNKHNPAVIPPDYDHFNYYAITDLSQDTVYYIQVRTVNIDNKVGSYNTNVPFVKASPRPEFTVTLLFERNPPSIDDSCAVRFSDAIIMADSAMSNGGADMWALNDSVIAFSFNSPNTHSQYGANTRTTHFVNLGNYELYSIFEVSTEPSESSVGILEGDLVIAKTEDGNYVKIYIDAIDDTLFTVTILYAYQNIIDFPYF
ncbi:fibronectin type III domain-containing protein [candidate division WOR-3 bacterium]|nr:fibronectin type III domain-containing protein [candidate division WOR-3 bacterium]